MSPQLYIDPENRISRVPYLVPTSHVHYVTLNEYEKLKAEVERSVEQYNSIIDQHLAENARLKAEVERLTEALNKLTNTPANADGVDVKVNFWTKSGTRLPSSFQTFWMHDSAKDGKPTE